MMIKKLIQSTLRAAALQKSIESFCLFLFLKFRCLFKRFPENTVNTIEAAKNTAVVNITRNIKNNESKWHWRLVQAFSVLSAGPQGQCSDAPFKTCVLSANETGLASGSG